MSVYWSGGEGDVVGAGLGGGGGQRIILILWQQDAGGDSYGAEA